MIPERKAQLRKVAGEFGDFETLGLLDDLEAAEARTRAVEEMLERIGIGGNHLASALVGMLGMGVSFPPYQTELDKARAIIGDVDKYDCWVCWRTIMLVRDEREAVDGAFAGKNAAKAPEFLFQLRAAAAEWLAEHPDDRNAPAVRRALLGTQ